MTNPSILIVSFQFPDSSTRNMVFAHRLCVWYDRMMLLPEVKETAPSHWIDGSLPQMFNINGWTPGKTPFVSIMK
jgi:hypothetical protein